jgi:peptidoglycan/LPS O-acetylase OafA/YrhL
VIEIISKPKLSRLSKLKVFQTINNAQRNTTIDVYRGIAILAVVIFHFNHSLPYGNLGVDLFFVISGLLIGGILVKDFGKQRLKYFKFILQRGFKIWPSYYFFLLFGNIFALILYFPEQHFIPLWDMKRYLLFYQNYTGLPFHWEFDHVWSLCVEEHFYIILPIIFLISSKISSSEKRMHCLFAAVISLIISGIVFKYISLTCTTGKDTYSATHNRIDALAWGVLLSLIIDHFDFRLKKSRNLIWFFPAGLIIFALTLFFNSKDNIIFRNVVFHSVIPISFFFMLLGTYYVNIKHASFIRIIAYYSYNWYLWHVLFVVFITRIFGNNVIGLLCYILCTFAIAVAFTVLIEEPFLGARRKVINYFFSK